VNTQSREDRDAEAKRADQLAAMELKERTTGQTAAHHMEGLEMSERVRKLFDLTNGNQSEVVKAQKQRGMELFQLRDGDTGSSAVQGTCSRLRVLSLWRAIVFILGGVHHVADEACGGAL
jgi:hypothetical protein